MAKRIIKPDSGNTLVLQEDNGSIDALTVETNGDVTLAEKLIIDPAKGIQFRTSTGGTGTFGSGILDDYEEGTWTPVVGGTGGTPSYNIQTASYVKIGAQVYCEAYVDLTVSPSGSANISISGLPFTSDPSSNRYRSGSIFPVKGFGGSWDMICLDLGNNSTAINLYKSSASTGNNFAAFNASDLGGSLNFRIAISYTV